MSLFTDIITGGSNNHQTTSEEANFYATDFFTGGIVGTSSNTSLVAPMTGAFSCNAQGTPDTTIQIGTGVIYVQATPTGQGSQMLRVRNTAAINTTISSNTSGSTRYDWVYVKIDPDKAVNPAVDASDVASIYVSRSTSNTSDTGTPPAYGQLIAIVTVANGFSSITNGNIMDMRVRCVPNGGTTGWYPTSGWTYASYDSTNKTGIVNVPSTDISDIGSKVRFINNNAIQYGIIQAKTSTTRTIYFGTDYSLTNSAILNPHYTPPKAAGVGFPTDPAKWTVALNDTTRQTKTSPVNNTWYNQGGLNISIPIGTWRVYHEEVCYSIRGSATAFWDFSTLSTTTSSESDTEFTHMANYMAATAPSESMGHGHIEKFLTLATATTYYLNIMTTRASFTSISLAGDIAPTKIRAINALL